MEEAKFLNVLEYFIENPYEEIYLRKIARKIKLSPYAAKKYLDILVKEKLIVEEKKANLRYFKANNNNLFFKHMKISYNIKKILDSLLIENIKEKFTNLTSITLFGSSARGEDDQTSDLDIVVIGKQEPLTLTKFEKKLKKHINLHVFSWTEWKKQLKINKAFYYDVISHGISLYGELPII